MKTTKKEIREELNCMNSVRGPYSEGNPEIKAVILTAQLESEKVEYKYGIATDKEIINRVHELINA